ncbi:MAG: TetR family transcriptional regulator, partial [Acidimicrobiales bacterium]|nr:TetR family transcriptional regulator [Acidimicrobiales bacterium]
MSRRTLDTDQVVDSAAALADSEGLDAVTLTRVALLLGVRQPALYRHIDSYDALIRALGLRGREILASRLGEAAVGLAGDDAVRAMGRAWRAMVGDHPGLYAATDRYPCAGDAELEEAVERVVSVLG